MSDDDALRAIMDAIEIDTIGEVAAVHFTPGGLADLASALGDMLREAEARGCARGVAAERAAVAAYLRAQAEEGGDPWMAYVADDVERGAHVAEGQPEVADG